MRAVIAAGVPARGAVDLAAIANTAGLGWGPTVVIGGRAYLGGVNDDRRASHRVAAEMAPGLLEALVPTAP